jgi:3-dehydroquinate dehydratase-2
MKILVINGPNLNLLGTREPEKYGNQTLKELESELKALGKTQGIEVEFFQSNHEGALIDAIHAAQKESDAILINPGGLTHTSVSLRDALLGVALPFIEVHISNIHAREEFRSVSLLSDIANGTITGLGPMGYELGIIALAKKLKS